MDNLKDNPIQSTDEQVQQPFYDSRSGNYDSKQTNEFYTNSQQHGLLQLDPNREYTADDPTLGRAAMLQGQNSEQSQPVSRHVKLGGPGWRTDPPNSEWDKDFQNMRYEYNMEKGIEVESVPISRKIKKGIVQTIKEPIFIISALIIIFVIFFMRAYLVPSGSMIPTLVEGDRILAIQGYFVNGQTYDEGDIVCFTSPSGTTYVKRIVANGGDVVEIVDDTLYVNGVVSAYQGVGTGAKSGRWTLADDEYFMMGDNRSNSQDSRYIGPISADKIIGKVYAVYWPISNLTWLGGQNNYYQLPASNTNTNSNTENTNANANSNESANENKNYESIAFTNPDGSISVLQFEKLDTPES